jgi:hypothetical protein
MKRIALSLALTFVLIFASVMPLTVNAAAYVTLEQAESVAVEVAKEVNPIFTGEHTNNGMTSNAEISSNEQFYEFFFYYFPPNSAQAHAEYELYVYIGETSGEVYTSYTPSHYSPSNWTLQKKISSVTNTIVSWETAYRDVLNAKMNDILGHHILGKVALKDVNADGIPELFFIATNGEGGNEADLVIYTYYNGNAVEVFSETDYNEAQMSPRAIPFISGSDFWVWMFRPSDTGIMEEYRRYALANGVLTISQTIPIEHRLFTEPDEMPDYERIAPPEAVPLDRLVDKQAEKLFENDALVTGDYSSVYSFLAERSSAPAPTINVPPAQSSITATPTASTVYVDGAVTSFDAYLIDGSNYFKMRDIAYALKAKFNVEYDEARRAVVLTKDTAYVVTGGEMQNSGGGNKTATPTSNEIYLGGQKISLTAYVIGGNNFVKLRDLAIAIGFDVDWRNNGIWIESHQAYTEEDEPAPSDFTLEIAVQYLKVNIAERMPYGYHLDDKDYETKDPEYLNARDDIYLLGVSDEQVAGGVVFYI